jgi:hypothetical protein
MKIKSLVAVAMVLALAASSSLPAQAKKKKGPGRARIKQAPTVTVGEVPPFPILSRQQWQANEPVSMMTPHRPQFITLHHTAMKQNAEKSLKEKMQWLQNYSQHEEVLAGGQKKPTWPDVPYHFLIAVDGQVAEGRNIGFVGDSNAEFDSTGHISVTLEGNFEKEEPTPEQMDSTRKVISFLAKKYHVPLEKIKAHRDYAQTACPGKNLYRRMDEIRGSVTAAQP